MKSLIFILVLLCSAAFATEEAYHFDDPAKQKLFLELTQELRCPQCQNQNIADSDAMIAVDLRRKVHELLQQGKSREQVMEFMIARYGNFVTYNPPVTAVTVWLWLLPLLFVIGAATFVLVQRKKQATGFDESELAKADSLLEKDN
ncbi:cytochrome c-type biogenesis protein [Aliiglaciecola litoralis]|uniref:Cytochrome c-type biogenesis protein n=1 Tax=Aliiglaciecola litoralis TaxID=582857 RepID=A0ABN1LHU7_9ALTE